MPRDPRAYITLANSMPEHYKVDPLSDSAFRGLIEAWCLCSRTRNDGRIPKATWTKKFKLKVRKELLASGLAVDNGETVDMHDYLEHQTSAAEIEETRKKRAQAGAVGGRRKAENLANAVASARANAVANGQQTSSPDVPEVEEEEERISGPVRQSAHVSNAGERDTPRGPAVSGEAWKLVRSVVPDNHPQPVRTSLALHAGELLRNGSDSDLVEAALRLWLSKPNLGPGVLPGLVSEVIKTGEAHTNTHGPATTKALGWLAIAEQRTKSQQKEIRSLGGLQ